MGRSFMSSPTKLCLLVGLALAALLLSEGISYGEAPAFPRFSVMQPAVAGPVSVAVEPGSALLGYTEAEIRRQLLEKYSRPLPKYRKLSGGSADTDYQPGTLDVKIPSYFFPAPVTMVVGESFLWNADGSLGLRSKAKNGQEKDSQVQAAAAEPAPAEKGKQAAAGKNGNAVSASIPPPRYKRVEVQITEPGASPFPALHHNDFLWLKNERGGYNTPLPRSLRNDPLKGLPAEGPMLLRYGAENEILAVTVDVPTDTYYYKNADTLPVFGKAVPVFTETRRNTQGIEMAIQYIRYYAGGQYLLAVVSAASNAGKTYRTAVVFPESEQYEYLPKALYVMENQQAVPVAGTAPGASFAQSINTRKKG